ncbi:MAG: SHIRT domain-containing protein [Collinsella sp.]|nr:SHIRT domain-containing protein [Collinsella sp.]
MRKQAIPKIALCTALAAGGIPVPQALAEEPAPAAALAPEASTEDAADAAADTPPPAAGSEEPAASNGPARAVPQAPTAPARDASPGVADVSYEGTVAFVGQWTDESTARRDTERAFTRADEPLGAPLPNTGLLRGLGKVFLGWSDQAPVDGKLAPGARLFSAADPVSAAFPAGLPTGARLYGVYFSMNDPDQPIPGNTFGLALSLVGGLLRFAPGDVAVGIHGAAKPDAVLPGTALHSTTVDEESGNVTVIDAYAQKDDATEVNEVVLSSEFKMDDTIAMIAYKNPLASNALLPVLSRNYGELLAGDAELPTAPDDASYTYVDLNVELGEGIKVPERLSLEFSGYSWRPLYVLNAACERLGIVDPATGADLGNTKASFSSLVSSADPTVRFDVRTGGSSSFVIRTILRHGDAERIPEAAVAAAEGRSKAETILSNMTLRVVPSSELADVLPGELASRVLTISDETAAALADTQGARVIDVRGSVSGTVRPDAGPVSFLTLSRAFPFGPNPSNTLSLGYWRAAEHQVSYRYESVTEGAELPAELVAPAAGTARAGEEISLETPKDLAVPHGTWRFTGWYRGEIADANRVFGAVTMGDEDLTLVGGWEYVIDQHAVTMGFVSATAGRELPEELAVTDTSVVDHGTELVMSDPDAVAVEGGTWTFAGWHVASAAGPRVTEESMSVVEDLDLVGVWEFTADPRPEVEEPVPGEPGQEEPPASKPDTGEKPAEKKPVGTPKPVREARTKAVRGGARTLPATGDAAAAIGAAGAATAAALGVGGALLRRRRFRDER